MSGSFDLNLLPLYRLEGRDHPEMPGLYAVKPPHRPARGRDADRLVLYLTVTGDLGRSAEQFTELLERLAQTYYKTAGTVTAALKTVADALNAAMLERNRQLATSGHQEIGLLTQLVLRGETVYLAHSGPVHAFLTRPQEAQHWYDPQGAGRGLGLSRVTTVRFYQASLKLNDFLLLAHQPAGAWATEGITIAPNQGLESLRRRLLSQAGQNLNAVVVQVQAGTGNLRLLRLKPAFQDMARPAKAPPESIETTSEQPAQEPETIMEEKPADLDEDISPGDHVDLSPAAPAVLPSVQEVVQPPESSQVVAPSPVAAGKTSAVEKEVIPPGAGVLPTVGQGAAGRVKPTPVKEAIQPPSKKPASGPSARSRLREAVQKSLKELGSIFGHTFKWLFGGLGAVLKRIMPDESVLNVSPAVMIFFALAIPILISVVGGVVYIQRGQQQQYQASIQQAQEAARQAGAVTDPAEQRAAWKVTLEYLDKAEFYQRTAESQELRSQAQAALDQLDRIERVDFEQALLNTLDKEVVITRIVVSSGDIYLLDSTYGNVYRGVLMGTRYEIDPSFLCGPQAATGAIGSLVDFTALPRGYEDGATVLGLDLNGRLIYCIPGDDPKIAALAPPPTNFSNPKALVYDSDDLYIIDPPNKAVWVYRNMEIDQPPHQYLGDITSFMVDVIDLAVNGDDLYLLHSNGRMTKCTFSWTEEAPTRCEDPFIYTDPRPGRQDGEVIPDALFDQVAFAAPPDPSLYMLDPQNRAIFHFSLRLNLDRQYQPKNELPEGIATAFAVSSTRMAYLAIGNQVFTAELP